VIALLFDLLFMPVCAGMAGLFLWVITGKYEQDDRVLVRDFLFILAACMLLGWGTSRTDTARMILDPQFRLQAELDAQPVYAALKRTAPDDQKVLHEFLVSRLSQGLTLPEAMLQARSLLTRLTNERLGFADQKTRVAWGRVTVDTLRELQARDPGLCYRALASQPLDSKTLSSAFSAGNTAAFQQAVVDVYESAHQGMGHERRPGDKPVEFNDAAREFSVISDTLAQQFGGLVSRQVSRKKFPEQPSAPAEQLCAVRIAQLDAMLARPQAMAAMLVDSVLR
jgi:hypothetical protein